MSKRKYVKKKKELELRPINKDIFDGLIKIALVTKPPEDKIK